MAVYSRYRDNLKCTRYKVSGQVGGGDGYNDER
jgi:hypothetical protein